MINIAVCEDEGLDREVLEQLIPKAAKKLRMDYCMYWFSSGKQLLEAVDEGQSYDLLIMDIFMDDINGVETARLVLSRLPQVMIAFITSSRDFAVDAYELNALHYIVKPVGENDVIRLLARYLERTNQAEPVMEVQTSREKIVFPASAVQKIESYKKGVAVYIRGEDEPRQIHSSFMSVEEGLDKNIFVRVARGLAVNMDYIDHISQGVCYFTDGTSALISRKDRAAVKKTYNDYLFRKIKNLGDL